MQRRQYPVRGHHRQRRPAAALTEQHGNRRRIEGDELGQAVGDLAGQAALFGLRGQRGSGGVDHQNQRQLQPGGQRHAAPGLAQRGRADEAAHDALLAEHDRGLATEPGQRQQRRRGLTQARSGQQHPFGGAVPQQLRDAGAVRPPRRHYRLPGGHVGQRLGLRLRRRRVGRVGDHLQRAVQHAAKAFERDHRVDDAVPLQVLGGLNAGRKRLAVEVLVHARPEEPDRARPVRQP